MDGDTLLMFTFVVVEIAAVMEIVTSVGRKQKMVMEESEKREGQLRRKTTESRAEEKSAASIKKPSLT